jgi:hypothetical protein
MRGRAFATLACLAVTVACSSNAPPLPSARPAVSSSPASGPAFDRILVQGTFVGVATFVRANVAHLSRAPQKIRWRIVPRCRTGACPLRIVSSSGHYRGILRPHGLAYRGTIRRPGFFRCAHAPERVFLRIVLSPADSERVNGVWRATRLAARLANRSVATHRCGRSYLITNVVAERITA